MSHTHKSPISHYRFSHTRLPPAPKDPNVPWTGIVRVNGTMVNEKHTAIRRLGTETK